MPTVLRVGAFTFRIFAPPREHPPPHVHVGRRGGGWITVHLPLDDEAVPIIRDYRGLLLHEIRLVLEIVNEHRALLLATWERLHGNSSAKPD